MAEWVKPRKTAPKSTEKTPQQLKIAEAGRKVAEECTGLQGGDYKLCRIGVLREIFPPEEILPENP